MHKQQTSRSPEICMDEYEEILFFLRIARQQARFSIRETGKNGSDEQFGRFINLLAGNVKAVLSIMTLKETVESSEGSFISFLGARELVQEKIARIACQMAVRTKDQLSDREIEKLVADLAKTDMPYTSPRGRPTLIYTSFTELDRKFSRD